MPKKRVPVKYPCTLGDYSDDDDMQEEDEDPTLSGGLPQNYDGEEDRQSLRSENENEEGDQVECGQGQQEQEDENDEDSSGPDSSEEEDAARAKECGTVALRLQDPPIARARNFLKDLLWHPGNARNG